MARFHIFSQYIWPDSGPDGFYAEQLARRLQERGCDVQLVGGKGTYRASRRERPDIPLLHVDHYCGRRGSLVQTFIQYAAVVRAFESYIKRAVQPDDVAIVTSAPPTSVRLAGCIHRRGARAIYWLQDYYPELVRGLREYPSGLRRALRRYWDRQLLRWDRVVKIGGNLGGPNENAVVIRNWPTLEMEAAVAPEPLTAIYSGNLGYGHDIGCLVHACEELRAAGYRITMRADGRGLAHLPEWLKPVPLHEDHAKLRDDLLRHEVHLVAADPRITAAIFPSKIWNSIASGRTLVCTGFAGKMQTELECARASPFATHLEAWVELAISLQTAGSTVDAESDANRSLAALDLESVALT